MEKVFVDTNIFIYSLFAVDQEKHIRCIRLFQKARDGIVQLWTTEWVVAELIWFLLRRKIAWRQIEALVISGVFGTKGLEIRERTWLLNILESCTTGKDFVDVVNLSLATVAGITRGYSYDTGLDRWEGFTRLEP